MLNSRPVILLVAIAAILFTAGTALAQPTPPLTIKFFGSGTVGIGGSTTLDITINNIGAVDLTGVTFTDTFPGGLAVATPNGLLSACTPGSTLGALTALNGSTSVSLAASTLAVGGACTIQVNVTGTGAGALMNSVTAVDAVAGAGNAATAGITVLATTPPTIAKVFGAPTIPLNGSTSLTFTVTAANALADVSFTDTLPVGLAVATPNALATTCGSGTVTAAPGSSTISMAGLTFAAAGSCTVTVNVTGITGGAQVNTVQATDANAGAGNVATATVVVSSPPTLTKAFNAPSININGTTNLTFTVTNPNAGSGLTGIAFTDTLPAGLVFSNPPGVINTCNGVVTAANNTTAFSLTGGTLAAGASCTITVTVYGVADGVFTNTTSTISSSGGVGLAATAPITVNPIIDPEVAFQVGYASNLNIGDSQVNLTNTGTLTRETGLNTTGNLCVNVYVFSPNEDMISCCSCLVTPNGLNSFSVKTDLTSNVLPPLGLGVYTSAVIKLVASRPLNLASDGSGGTCNASALTPLTVTPGLGAWRTTLHAIPTAPVTYKLTETPFATAPLGVGELRKLTLFCGFIQDNGSGFGICRSCRTGGLGASGQ